MTYLQDEGGIESSIPREGIELIQANGTTLIATGTRNVTINGRIFTAGPAGRGEIKIVAAANDADLEIVLPLSHPIPQRYMQGGVPPRSIQVKVWRKQVTSGEARIIWRGLVTSMAIDHPDAKLLVPASLSRVLRRRLPTVTVGRTCPHILYDKNCRIDREAYKVAGTIGDIDGITIRVNVAAEAAVDWATFGEFHHTPTLESVTIFKQEGGTDLAGPHMTLTVQLPIPGMQIGDAVTVYAGCSHLFAECRTKFNNVLNFGGFPYIPTVQSFSVLTQGLFARV